jgi:serine/threonine-protein kinase
MVTRPPGISSKRLQPGDVLFGRFRFEEVIAEGNEGSVLLVDHVDLRRRAALKVIGPGIARDVAARGRLLRAAALTARVGYHPNIVRVDDLGFPDDSDPDGTGFILMEYVPGDTVKARLPAAGPAPLGWVAPILKQLCAALDPVHEAGIILRDIKPSNLLLTEGPSPGTERLKLTVFGLARWLDAGKGSFGVHTRSDEFFGDCLYASPEWLRGGSPDERSDIYSVGVILYELLTGRPPFQGDFATVTAGHAHGPPPPFSETAPGVVIPPAVEQVVMKCLAKEPSQRYQSAGELAEAFLAALPPASRTAPPAWPGATDLPPRVTRPKAEETPPVEGCAPVPVVPLPAKAGRDPRAGGPPTRPLLRVVFRRGVVVARLAGPVTGDAADTQAVVSELVGLTGCNPLVVLDVSDAAPARMSARLYEVLAHAHDDLHAAGGLLKIIGLGQEQESALAVDRAERVTRPYPASASGKQADRARRPHGGRVAIENEVCDWLQQDDTPGVPPAPAGDGPAPCPGPALEVALRDPALGYRVRLDVLILEPRRPRLDTEASVAPLCRALAALRGRRAARNAVINLCYVVTLSESAGAALAAHAGDLARAGGRLRLSHVRPALMATIRQTALGCVADVYPTADDAVVARWDGPRERYRMGLGQRSAPRN